jgi:HK97 family phage portal protein
MLGLFGRMMKSGSGGGASSGVPSGYSFGSGIPGFGSLASSAGVTINQATAMTVSAVSACVRIRAGDIARCHPSLYRLGADGSRETVSDHAVAALFRRPNAVQTWFEFARDLSAAYVLRGNGYAAIIRDRSGTPVQLIGINPDAVQMLEASDGGIYYQVNRFGLWMMAVLRGEPLAIPAEDMLHVRDLSFNTLLGASTIGLAKDTLGLSMAQTQQMARWAGNGARPSGVLTTDKSLSPAAATRMKEGWREFAAGLLNVGTTAVLEEGVKWQQLQLTSVDLEFIAQCNLSVQDIARHFRVPTRKLAMPDLARGSTIIQEEQDYVNTVVAPDLDMIEQKMAMTFDLDIEGLGVDFDEGRLLRADAMTRFNTYRLGVLTGIITPNEARRAENLPPIEGGDKLLVPSNTAALGSDMTGNAPDGAGRPAGGNAPTPGVPTGGSQPDAAPVDA